jgi:hypothetical protein
MNAAKSEPEKNTAIGATAGTKESDVRATRGIRKYEGYL